MTQYALHSGPLVVELSEREAARRETIDVYIQKPGWSGTISRFYCGKAKVPIVAVVGGGL